MLPTFSLAQWLLVVLAAFCIGFAKAGFSGVGLFTVVVMARLFPPRESTGILLPMLICGDILSVWVYHQHAQWSYIRRMLPQTAVGIVFGFGVMQMLPAPVFGPVIGGMVLLMVVLQLLRDRVTSAYGAFSHTHSFAWTMGIFCGFSTMLANAAGPVMSLYLLAVEVPKFELVGTSSWFFLLVNLIKLPFSAAQGLITPSTLLLNLTLAPAVAVGILAGRSLIRIIPQKLFEKFLLIFATMAALRLLGAY